MNEEIALILDPQRERPGWWRNYVDIEARTVYPASIPALATDDAAAFAHVRPVLLAAGLDISENSSTCVVLTIYLQDVSSATTYAATLCAALVWLRDNQPEVLNRAIAQVREA